MKKSEQRAFEAFPEGEILPRFINLEEQVNFYRHIYIKAYEQAEKDKNEEIYNNKTVLPKAGENIQRFKDLVTNELGKLEKPCKEDIEL